MSNSTHKAVDAAIKNRKTQKVLAEEKWDIPKQSEQLHDIIHDLLDLAAFAPYHKRCHEKHLSNQFSSGVPWRVYVLDANACRQLYDYIQQENIKAGKISNMLAAADALLLVTWLPEPSETLNSDENNKERLLFEGNLKNMEHIAAASAAIQNILIGATARNIPNYWSSGGQLRQAQLRTHLSIPLEEPLLGALFLFPEDSEKRGAFIKPGALRKEGKKSSEWSRWIESVKP